MIAAQTGTKPSTHVMGISKFERFFRVVAGLDIDKADLQRYNKFINHKLRDLLVRGEEVARANGRHIIEPSDLPITKGLQECIDAFQQLNEAIPLAPILAHLAATPPLELGNSDETEARLPSIAGGLSVALARSFTIIDPELKHPRSEHWRRSLRIFDLLL
jgi:hypothetical protein